MITIEEWTVLGLDPLKYVGWTLTSIATRRLVKAECSVVRSEGWIVFYPDPRDRKTDIPIGVNLKPQMARDIADFLAGRAKIPLYGHKLRA